MALTDVIFRNWSQFLKNVYDIKLLYDVSTSSHCIAFTHFVRQKSFVRLGPAFSSVRCSVVKMMQEFQTYEHHNKFEIWPSVLSV